MALGKKCRSEVRCGCLRKLTSDATDIEVLPLVPSRKRVISDCNDTLSNKKSPSETPLKNQSKLKTEGSLLESMPQDLLVQIFCGVDHADLEQLYHVSNKIRDAALIAKQWHFAFCTPSSKTTGFKKISSDLEEANELEAPNAPKQERTRSRISGKKLAGITVALFRSSEKEEKEEEWSRNEALLVQTL